jgi:peptidoglycan/LPS O-acetylase OafA/YrhL
MLLIIFDKVIPLVLRFLGKGKNGKYFEAFAVSMLIALPYVYTQNTLRGELLRAKLQRWSPWMFLAGLFILGFLSVFAFYLSSRYHSGLAFLDPYRTVLGPIYTQWQSIGYSICYALCMCALLYNSSWLRRPFEWPVLRWIGLFSFSLYMWHLPFLLLFMDMMSHRFQGLAASIQLTALLAWVFFVIFPLSLTLYRWVEMPGMRLGETLIQRIEKRKKQPPVEPAGNIPNQEPTSAMTGKTAASMETIQK